MPARRPPDGKANNPGVLACGMKAGAIVSLVLGGLVGILLLVAGSLYLNDYGLEATVVEKSCTPPGPFGTGGKAGSVTVETKLFAIRHTVQDIDATACAAIQPGNFVIYHIRTGATYLFESQGGECLYPPEAAAAGTCA